MIVLKEYAQTIADVALQRAMAEHPTFASDHEGYAILLEEAEEAEFELNAIKRNLGCVWSCVRTDRHEESLEYVEKVRKHALLLIAEAAQVAAMCEKYGRGDNDAGDKMR